MGAIIVVSTLLCQDKTCARDEPRRNSRTVPPGFCLRPHQCNTTVVVTEWFSPPDVPLMLIVEVLVWLAGGVFDAW